MDKVRVIEQSLKCRRWGYWCLLPLAGVVAIVAIFLRRRKIRAELAGGWNPARRPLLIGFLLAQTGILLNVAVIGIIVAAILSR